MVYKLLLSFYLGRAVTRDSVASLFSVSLRHLYAHPPKSDSEPKHRGAESGVDDIQHWALLELSFGHVGYDKEPGSEADDRNRSRNAALLGFDRPDGVEVGIIMPRFAELVGKVVAAGDDNSGT
jgi:hypothetical protein